MADKKNNRRNNRNNNDDDFNPKFKKRKKVCPLCKEKNLVLDYKNPEQLKKFINERGKILPRRATGGYISYYGDRETHLLSVPDFYSDDCVF